MIGWLKGELVARRTHGVIISAGGVGYLVNMAGVTLADKEIGEVVEVHIYTQVREDTLALFGFENEAALETFNSLISVSGVGPKLAVGLLGGISSTDLAMAIEMSDAVRLKALPGVGKRLAERLIVELKGKLKASEGLTASAPLAGKTGVWADLKSALANLQYRPKEVERTLEELGRTLPEGSFDELFREAMKLMRRS
jgi:Holliday junction DNA helicase RuvA